MVTTTGNVQKVSFITAPPTRGGCARIGPSPFDAEQFILFTRDTDPPEVREHTISMLEALATAMAGRLPVAVDHEENSAVVLQLTLNP